MTRIIHSFLLTIFAVFLLGGISRAGEPAKTNEEGKPSGIFKPGKFVIEHVSDAFEWHIATFGETEISIPLPIILYSSNKDNLFDYTVEEKSSDQLELSAGWGGSIGLTGTLGVTFNNFSIKIVKIKVFLKINY